MLRNGTRGNKFLSLHGNCPADIRTVCAAFSFVRRTFIVERLEFIPSQSVLLDINK